MNALALQSKISLGGAEALTVLLYAPLLAAGLWLGLRLLNNSRRAAEHKRKFTIKAERWAERAATLIQQRQALHGWLVDEAFGLALRLHTLSTTDATSPDVMAAAQALAAALENAKAANTAALDRLARRERTDPIGDQRIPALEREWHQLEARCAAVDALLANATGAGHRALLGERQPTAIEIPALQALAR